MSCRFCEAIEVENMKGRNKAYLRIGNASVLVSACNKHFNLLRRKLGMDLDILTEKVFRYNDPDR